MYEDEKVEFIIDNDGYEVYEGVVVAFDWDIGCTIMNVEDKTDILICIHMLMSPKFIGHFTPEEIDCNTGLMRYIEDCIKENKPIIRSKYALVRDKYGVINHFSEVNSSYCPFNQ